LTIFGAKTKIKVEGQEQNGKGRNAMAAVQQIFTEYLHMRDAGATARDALNALRGQIEQLDDRDRQNLGDFLRAYESGEQITTTEKTEPTRTVPIRNIAKKKLGVQQEQEKAEVVWVTCPSCGKSNQKHELVCYACGQLLEPPSSEFETRSLAETN